MRIGILDFAASGGDGRFMAEYVAYRDPFRHRSGVEEVEPGRHGLQQAQARRGRKCGAPYMTDHHLGIREQGAKLRSIAVIVEDRAF
jgi:hypothetical protein